MEAYICRTCGVQQAESEEPPSHCAICDDERQYVPPGGQRWVTLAGLRGEGRRIEVRDLEPGLTGIGANPTVGIGQRALLVQAESGDIALVEANPQRHRELATLPALHGRTWNRIKVYGFTKFILCFQD